MGSLDHIKNSISDLTISNLSGHLGETEHGVRIGLNLGINTFLTSVIKFVSNEIQADSLIKILNDGGHTGNIFNNIETFSGNIDKAKLLEAIGSNIINHFLKGQKTEIIDTITNISGVKSSSAYSLLNISAPIVLGYIGKKVKEQSMSPAGLKVFLDNEKGNTIDFLPISIQKILNISEQEVINPSNERHTEVVSELNEEKSITLNYLLPWIILLGLGLFIYLFSERNKRKLNERQTVQQETVVPAVGLPRDSSDITQAQGNDAFVESTIEEEKGTEKPIETEKPVLSEVEEPKPVVVTPSPAVTPPAPLPRNTPTPSQRVSAGTLNNTPKVNNTPSGYSELENTAFSRNSAEIVDQSKLTSLVNELKNSDKKIIIIPMSEAERLGKDRAFSLREQLLEKGVKLSQIRIADAVPGNNSIGMAFKIEN